MNLWTVGLSHHSAPVEIRERLALDAHSLVDYCQRLRNVDGIAEGLLISTCNRVEAIAIGAEGKQTGTALLEFLLSTARGAGTPDRKYFYSLHDRESVRHLFRVASSLDSMIVGEPQILGQLKTAYTTAKEVGALHGPLEMVVTRAFSVAKRVRNETGIGESAVSVSFAAVELARRIFGSLKGKRVLIVGAGKMSELAAKHLHNAGAEHIFVTNRTHQRAVEIASVFRGQSFLYEELFQRMPEMDIVITSSGAPHYVVSRAQMKTVMDERRHRPTFLIDIAVPRNIEPTVHDLDQVFLYDIDDLQKVVQENLKGRAAKADQAEEIVQQEVEKTILRLKTREVAPTIVELQSRFESIRQGEIERLRRKLGELTAGQEEAIEALTRGIVNKIAHGPIAEIRRHAADPDALATVDVLRRAFRLENGIRPEEESETAE